MKTYYAIQSPRGFGNELSLHLFGSKAERDQWVKQHEHDGGQNSAARGAKTCSAEFARSLEAEGSLTAFFRGDDRVEKFRLPRHAGRDAAQRSRYTKEARNG